MAKPVICSLCGSIARPKSQMQGSILVEAALWCMFLFPGVLYSLWRLTTRRPGCRQCGSSDIVPLSSPRGRALLAKQQQVQS